MSGILDYILENVKHLHAEYIKHKENTKLKQVDKETERPLYERTVVANGIFELSFE
jgi:hypothetical protein